MMVNDRAQNDGKNGEKKGELTEPTPQKGEHEGSPSGGTDEQKGSETKPSGTAESDPHGERSGQAKRILGETQKRLRARAHEIGQRLLPLENWLRTTARERPFQVMATTSGVGLLAGALLRRVAGVGAAVTLGLLTVYYVSRRQNESTSVGSATQN